MTQPMWQHAVRRAVGPLAGLALVLAACSAPSVHDDRAPTATLVARAHEALQGDAAERAAGHRDLTWLCLLRGSGCADLAQHGRAALTATVAEQTPEALLETLTNTRTKGQKVSAEISLQFVGIPSRTDQT